MTHKDNRNWRIYNEKLVRRGEFYLSFEFLENWNQELAIMNRGKRERPFEYPETFAQFSGLLYVFFHLPYRQLEGALRKLEKFIPKLKAADYSTLWHRITNLKLELPRYKQKVVVAVDSTGIKVTNRGEWIRKNWKGKERRGWIKVHIAVDVKTKELLAIEVIDEKTADCETSRLLRNLVALKLHGNFKMLKPLLEDIDLKDILADGAYDNEDAFKFSERKGIGPPGIKIRENASRKGLSDRAFAVREFQDLGYDKWKEKHNYGQRWASEGVFSAVKRYFGETVRATSVEGMILEVKRKFMFYNMLLSM